MNRSILHTLSIFLVVALFLTGQILATPLPRRRSPNIILIVADDLGYGDLGCYGQKFIKTPRLDQMASEGVRFTQFYSASPVCAPSRASLMTGLHQGHALIRGNTDVQNKRVSLGRSNVTVAEVLKAAGYRTGIIGKWGLGEPNTEGIPNRKGFDYWFGYLNQTLAHNYYPTSLWRNEEQVAISHGTYSHDLFTREALDFVRRERAHPFFLYLAYTIPHANNELTSKTGNGMEVPDDSPYASENWPAPQKNYAAMVTRMDTDIGKLIDLLRELRIDKDTIVFFTSDNGPQGKGEGGVDPKFFASAGIYRGIKRELYEGGIRVPMIVRWPGKIASGREDNQVWTLYDFFPTAVAIAQAPLPVKVDGVSELSLLRGGRARPRKSLYWEFHEGGFVQAARLSEWKGIRRGLTGTMELYNLAADPTESNNVAEQYPKIIRRLENIMKREHVESAHWPLR